MDLIIFWFAVYAVKMILGAFLGLIPLLISMSKGNVRAGGIALFVCTACGVLGGGASFLMAVISTLVIIIFCKKENKNDSEKNDLEQRP